MASKRERRRRSRPGVLLGATVMNAAVLAGAIGLLLMRQTGMLGPDATATETTTPAFAPGGGAAGIVHALPAPSRPHPDGDSARMGLVAAPDRAADLAHFDDPAFTPGDNPPMPAGIGILLEAPKPIARDDAAFAAILAVDGAVATTGRFGLAQFAAQSGGPLHADFALWARLRAGAAATDMPWAELTAFLERRRDWPDRSTLLAAAEYAMPADLPPGQVLDFFGSREPETARGARRLGEAQIATGKRADGEARLIATWRGRTLDAAEEKAFLDAHATLLEPHHPERLEMLMLRRRASAARRLAGRVNEDWRALTTAVSALFRSSRGVDKLIGKVPAALQNRPSLAFARMVWRQKKNRNSDAEALLRERRNADALGAPDVWAAARRRHARRAFEDSRFQDAYDIAAAHGLASGVDFAELEWFAGWLALRRFDNPEAAAEHFQALYRGVGSPISRGRAAYWTGRALAARGDSFGADAWYALAAAHPNTFYGQQAAAELGVAPVFEDTPPDDAAIEGAPGASPALAEIATALYRAGRHKDAGSFLAAKAEADGDAAEAIGLALGHQDLRSAISIASDAQTRGQAIWSALYPAPVFPSFEGRRSEAAFLLAIARQESRFQARAASSAGAQGLMQMTHGTARGTARNAGLVYDSDRLETDPDYNLLLSDAHVEELVDQYDGSYLLVAAAYNAGPGAVARWIRENGDPRDPDVDVIDWIESIPYGETRNYVQRVLEATAVYRARLGTPPQMVAGLPVRIADSGSSEN